MGTQVLLSSTLLARTRSLPPPRNEKDYYERKGTLPSGRPLQGKKKKIEEEASRETAKNVKVLSSYVMRGERRQQSRFRAETLLIPCVTLGRSFFRKEGTCGTLCSAG